MSFSKRQGPSQADSAPSGVGVVEEMVRKAAHDLRAPVRQIKSFAGFLLEDLGPAVTPEATQDVENILQGVERLQALIDGMSDLALAGARPVELEPMPIHSGLPIDDTHPGFSLPDPPPLALADFEMLCLFWRRLLLAAAKLSVDAATPTVAVEVASAEQIAIRVTVKRPAFGVDEVRRAFEPFPVHPGHPHDPGASLAICRRAAERMGGSVTAEETPSGVLLLIATLVRPPEEGAEEGAVSK